MPGTQDDYQEFRVLLRQANPAESLAAGAASPRQFTAIVSAPDESGARNEADSIVRALNNYVEIVSITRI
jgi:hypothetical protein